MPSSTISKGKQQQHWVLKTLFLNFTSNNYGNYTETNYLNIQFQFQI